MFENSNLALGFGLVVGCILGIMITGLLRNSRADAEDDGEPELMEQEIERLHDDLDIQMAATTAVASALHRVAVIAIGEGEIGTGFRPTDVIKAVEKLAANQAKETSAR